MKKVGVVAENKEDRETRLRERETEGKSSVPKANGSKKGRLH